MQCWLRHHWSLGRRIRKVLKYRCKVPSRTNVTASISPIFDSSRTRIFISRIVRWTIAALNVVVAGSIGGSTLWSSQQVTNFHNRQSPEGSFNWHISNVVIKGSFTVARVTNTVGIIPAVRVDPLLAWNIHNIRVVFQQGRPSACGLTDVQQHQEDKQHLHLNPATR